MQNTDEIIERIVEEYCIKLEMEIDPETHTRVSLLNAREAMKAALEASGMFDEWKPIETKPDGVLCYLGAVDANGDDVVMLEWPPELKIQPTHWFPRYLTPSITGASDDN